MPRSHRSMSIAVAMVMTTVACSASRERAPTDSGRTVTVPPVSEPASTESATSSPDPTGSPGSAVAFGFDRVHESCNSFTAHITNASKTAWLDVFVNVEALQLSAGSHELPIDGQAVRLAITELANPHDGEWSCTDVGGGPMTQVTNTWKADRGNVRVHLHLPAPGTTNLPYDGPYDRVDIALENVRFVDARGNERLVTLHFQGLRIGWMPG